MSERSWLAGERRRTSTGCLMALSLRLPVVEDSETTTAVVPDTVLLGFVSTGVISPALPTSGVPEAVGKAVGSVAGSAEPPVNLAGFDFASLGLSWLMFPIVVLDHAKAHFQLRGALQVNAADCKIDSVQLQL